MKYLYALMGIFLLLAATACAGSFEAGMDVDTYVDAENGSQSFSDSDILWASPLDGSSTEQIYLRFINLFGARGIYKPEQIASANINS